MLSSVKPWALAKVANFSLISALGAWVRPGAEGEAAGLHRETSLGPHPQAWGVPELPRGPGLRPGSGSWRGTRTVERGHAEVLTGASEALGVEQGIGLVVRLHHRHLVVAAPVWGPRRQPRWVGDPWGGRPLWAGVGGALMLHPLSSCLPCPSPDPCFLPAQRSGPKPEVLGAQQTHRLRKSGVHGTATNSAAKLLSGGGGIRSGEVVPGQGVRRPEVLGRRAAEGVGEALGAAGRGSRQLGRFHPGAEQPSPPPSMYCRAGCHPESPTSRCHS